MVQVPELFTQYISSFSGCMGGNPNAPIWLVVDHSARCPLPIDPEKVFANPVTNIDALKRAPPTTCPCTESVTRLINSITGNPEAETSLVFKPEGQEDKQPILLLSASPLCTGMITTNAWMEKLAVTTPDGEVTMAKYTGLPSYRDFLNFLVAQRGQVFQAAVAEKSPKIILCSNIFRANDYFKLFGADRKNVEANDFFLVAPVMKNDKEVRTLVFVTDMLGLGTGDMTPENELELQQAGNEFRHYAHDAFGDGWLGQFSGELLTLKK